MLETRVRGHVAFDTYKVAYLWGTNGPTILIRLEAWRRNDHCHCWGRALGLKVP